MAIEYRKHKYVLCATVIYPILWVLALFGLLFSDNYYPVSWFILMILILGYILFCLAFDHECEDQLVLSPMESGIFDDRSINTTGLTIIFCFALTVGAVYLTKYIKYISLLDIGKTLLAINSAKSSGSASVPLVFVYLSSLVKVSMLAFFLLFLRASSNESVSIYKRKKLFKKRSFVLVALFFVILLSNFSRNALLNTILPLLFALFITHKTSNRKIVLYGSIAFIFFVFVFVWYTTIRSAFLFERTGFWETMFNNFSLYLSGAIVGLDQLLERGIIHIVGVDGGGKYTFSLILAIIDTIFGTSLTPEVVQSGIKIGTTSTNVYTVYQWTAMDFGVIYALLWQIPLGALYGALYKGVCLGKLVPTFWYCLLSYPLVMMFFQEQYFSIAQSWFITVIAAMSFWLFAGRTKIRIKMSRNPKRSSSHAVER